MSPPEWPCIKVGGCVSFFFFFNFSLILWAKSQDSVHKPQFLKRKESRSGSNRGPPAYQPSALPLGHTGSPPTERAAIYMPCWGRTAPRCVSQHFKRCAPESRCTYEMLAWKHRKRCGYERVCARARACARVLSTLNAWNCQFVCYQSPKRLLFKLNPFFNLWYNKLFFCFCFCLLVSNCLFGWGFCVYVGGGGGCMCCVALTWARVCACTENPDLSVITVKTFSYKCQGNNRAILLRNAGLTCAVNSWRERIRVKQIKCANEVLETGRVARLPQ